LLSKRYHMFRTNAAREDGKLLLVINDLTSQTKQTEVKLRRDRVYKR
jgi:hypothetical protein